MCKLKRAIPVLQKLFFIHSLPDVEIYVDLLPSVLVMMVLSVELAVM